MGDQAKTRLPEEWEKEAARASILDLALTLGADLSPGSRAPRQREHFGPCPVCGGTDRFSVNTQKNVFNCRVAGEGGGPINLVKYVKGLDYRDAVLFITGNPDPATGEKPEGTRKPVKPAPQTNKGSDWFRQKSRQEAYDIWKLGLRDHPLVDEYFQIRGLVLPGAILHAFRLVENLPYVVADGKGENGKTKYITIHEGPAILAPITGPNDRFIGLHRSWIDVSRANGKAEIIHPGTGEVLNSRKVLGSQKGGKIVIFDDTSSFDEALCSEGYENTLSKWALNGFPTGVALWAGINRDNICGPASDRVKHPLAEAKTKTGKRRTKSIPGSTPDYDQRDCLAFPKRFKKIILGSDNDGDLFEARVKRDRARIRHANMALEGPCLSREVIDDAPPQGKDWNDVLRDQRDEENQSEAAE